MNSETKQFDQKCLICSDVACGNNFNALSCRSCKEFFRRNAFRIEDFACLENNCLIDIKSRKECRKCRLSKCFSVGMKKEFVNLENKNFRYKISTKLSDCDLALIKRIQLPRGQIELNYEKIHSVDPIFKSVHLAAIFTRNYVAFCKNIPSFKALSKSDQCILIKCSFAEMCAIWNVFLYDENQNDGTPIDFTTRMKKVISNDTKIRDLLIIQLLFKIRPSIQCPQFVRNNQLVYVQLLKRYFLHKFADIMKAKFRFKIITNLLNDIGPVSESIAELFENEVNPSLETI